MTTPRLEAVEALCTARRALLATPVQAVVLRLPSQADPAALQQAAYALGMGYEPMRPSDLAAPPHRMAEHLVHIQSLRDESMDEVVAALAQPVYRGCIAVLPDASLPDLPEGLTASGW